MRRRFFSSKSKISFNIDNYLTIIALEDGLTVAFPGEIEYGIDGIGWNRLSAREPTPSIRIGQTISFKGHFTPIDWLGIGTFIISKRCNLSGNCMSILFGDNAADNLSLEGKDYAFYHLFDNCTTIVGVSSDFLPATTLADSCYFDMFSGCTSLTTAPELPATTLAEDCYVYMFSGCTSLTTAPALPATTLAIDCYGYMFSGCTSLTTAPALPATTLERSCYGYMFSGCTSLTTAPELPATTLAEDCYEYMFSGCTSLSYIKMLATDISASSCLLYWVYRVASEGTFVKNSAMNDLPTGVSGIPSGWTVVNDGSEGGGSEVSFIITEGLLPSVDVEYKCIEGMTWDEWVNSEYNTSGYIIMDDRVLEKDGIFNIGIEGSTVFSQQTIDPNYKYSWV